MKVILSLIFFILGTAAIGATAYLALGPQQEISFADLGLQTVGELSPSEELWYYLDTTTVTPEIESSIVLNSNISGQSITLNSDYLSITEIELLQVESNECAYLIFKIDTQIDTINSIACSESIHSEQLVKL